jgi:hypothetical protein
MKHKNFMISAVAVLLLLFVAGIVFAQAQAPAAGKDAAQQMVTMQGKIGYIERSGEFTVIGENPPSVVLIVNPNKKVLDKLKKSGKTITIEGHFTIGADHLMIDKIDGKKY